MSQLPIHPRTGQRALGMSKRGPIWPVIGASDDDPSNDQQKPHADPPADKGFPENTPIAEMTVEQQLAYFKHHDRRKAGILSAFDGVKPEDVKAMRDRLAELERGQMDASEKALVDARAEADTAARADEAGKWGQKLLESVTKAVLDKEQADSFLAIASADKFIADGEFDVDGLIGHLTGMFGTKQPPEQRQWGQNGTTPPAKSAREEGLAEARRRGFITEKE